MKKRFIAIIMSALLAAVLCGCGDGDRDASAVSGAEVSIEQSGEISGSASEDISLGEMSWDEVSKDYSAEKQIGESGIFIAVKKLSSSQKVYALEKGGKLITDFEFDTVSVIGSQYIVLAKNDNIAEIRDFSGNKICNTAYRIAAHEEKDGELAEIRRGDGTKEERTAVKTTGSSGDELYSAVKGEGKNARYALVSGGETAGGGYIFDSVLVTGYDYVEITEYNGLARAKDSDGLYTLFSPNGRVKSICYKEERSYSLYGTDAVSMYALRADDKDEYTWYVRRIENGAATLEEYDEKAVYARDFDKLGGLLTKVAAAVKKDAMRPELDGLVSEEIIKEYYAAAADAAASSVGFETSLNMARDMHPYVWALYCLSKEDRGSGNEPYPDGMQGVVYAADTANGVYRMSFSLSGGYAFMATKSDGKGGIIITEIVLML